MRAKLAVLSRSEIDTIHGATVKLLEHTGVRVLEPRALRLLQGSGAVRVEDGERVRIPEALVQEALAKVPKRWTWYARESKNNLSIGDGGRTKLGPGSACTNVIDFETGIRRAPTQQDGDTFVRLMDALEYVDINYTPVTPTGSEGASRFRETSTLVRDLQNTSKVLVGPSYDGRMAKDGLEIAKILAGGADELRERPMLAGYCDPVSPLTHDRTMTETLMEYAAMGQPVFLTCLDLAGASAPASLAGTLIQQNAEILSALLIAQLVNPKAPVIYGCLSGTMDMKAGNAALGGPEFGLLSAASVQIAHSYGLPCTTGGQSDAKIHDAQAAFEKATTLSASVLAGADFVDLFFGSYEGYNTTSLEQVVVDHEIAGYVFRYARGIEVDDRSLSLDLISEVGPGGSFLRNPKALRDTMSRMKSEHYLPFLIDRRSADGGPVSALGFLGAAHARVQEILANHQPVPLDPQQLDDMDAVLKRIRMEEARKS